MKIKKILISTLIFAALNVAIIPASASFNVSADFDSASSLTADWIASGTVTPVVARQENDTPEYALRLTTNDFYQNGFVLYNKPFNLSQGVEFNFNQYQWGGTGADGLVFFIKDASDNSQAAGGLGGALGYAPNLESVPGISGALLGVGFDAYGNYAYYEGTGCSSNSQPGSGANQILVKGPGQGFVGYCTLAAGYDLAANSKKLISNSYETRAASSTTVKILIDSPFIKNPRVKVYYENVLVQNVALPAKFDDVSEIKFGFTAGTGASTNFNEVSAVVVKTLNAALPFSAESKSTVVLANTGSTSTFIWFLGTSALTLMGVGFYLLRIRRVVAE